jgi:hypothetical protein
MPHGHMSKIPLSHPSSPHQTATPIIQSWTRLDCWLRPCRSLLPNFGGQRPIPSPRTSSESATYDRHILWLGFLEPSPDIKVGGFTVRSPSPTTPRIVDTFTHQLITPAAAWRPPRGTECYPVRRIDKLIFSDPILIEQTLTRLTLDEVIMVR